MKQESHPAWTQESYRPLRSKCSLCCSVLGWGGGVPWSGWGITPSWPGWTGGRRLHHHDLAGWGRDYPILTWLGVGYPILSWPGVPYPDLAGGTLSWPGTGGGEYPILTWLGGGYSILSWPGVSYPDLARGYAILTWLGECPILTMLGEYPILTWLGGYPILTWLGGGRLTNPDLARGNPILTWPGGIPSWSGWGVPHRPGLGSLPQRTWNQRPGKEPGTGVPPPLERTWN